MCQICTRNLTAINKDNIKLTRLILLKDITEFCLTIIEHFMRQKGDKQEGKRGYVRVR